MSRRRHSMGFLVGQTVQIAGQSGTWTVVAINDALIDPLHPEEGADPNDNSILVLSGSSLAGVASGSLTITAIDKDVITVNKSVDVAQTIAGGIIVRTDGGAWTGFAVGDFISINEDFAKGEYQIVSISGSTMRVIGGGERRELIGKRSAVSRAAQNSTGLHLRPLTAYRSRIRCSRLTIIASWPARSSSPSAGSIRRPPTPAWAASSCATARSSARAGTNVPADPTRK